MCPGNLSFLSVRVKYAAAVWPDKRIKALGVCLSLPLTHFFFFLLLMAWRRATGADSVTLRGIKQDSALRQRQTREGMSSSFCITPAAFALLLAWLLSCSAAVLGLSLRCANMTELQVVLPPRGWFVHSWSLIFYRKVTKTIEDLP